MDFRGFSWICVDLCGWRRIGGGLEEDGGGLEEDFRGYSLIVVDFRNFLWGRSNWLKIAKNNFLRFLPFYPLISAFQALSCLANDRSRRDLSIGIENS